MNIKKNIKKTAACLALSLILVGGNSSALYADDTDIYLAPPSVIRNDAPNVLIIVDTSTSMEWSGVGTKIPYDSTKTYTDVASNGNTYQAGAIYWAVVDPNNLSADITPAQNSLQYISSTNMKCEAAFAAFETGATAGSRAGIYAGDRIALWTPAASGGKGTWKTPSLDSGSTVDEFIECKTDRPNQESGGSPYANGGSVTNKYTNAANNELVWDGIGQVKLFSPNWLNWNADNSPATSSFKKRMEVAQNAVRTLIQSNVNVNMGLMVFNPYRGGRVINRILPVSTATRADLLDSVDRMRGWAIPDYNADGSNKFGYGSGGARTPLSETLYEARQYLTGGSTKYGGKNWWLSGLAGGNAGYPRPFSDMCAEDDSISAYCAPYNYAAVNRYTIYNTWDTTNWYANLPGADTYKSPFAYECQQAYIILVTDGDPSSTDNDANTEIDAFNNNGATKYPTPISSAGNDTSEAISFDGGTAWDNKLDDLAGYMYETDQIDNNILPGQQRIVTYTIGFAGVSAGGEKLLKKTAEVGHGQYYEASDAAKLSVALQAALVDIQQTTSSFAAPSLSVNAFNKLFNRDEIYFALFKPSSTTLWDGNIKKLRLCNTADAAGDKCVFGDIIDSKGIPAIDTANLRIKDTSVSFWNSVADGGVVTDGGTGLATQTAGPTSRKLYTYYDSTSTTDLYANLSSANNVELVTAVTNDNFYTDALANKALLGATITTDAEVRQTINWMKGYSRSGTSTKRWPIGDPLHSRPVALTVGAKPDGSGNPDPDNPIIKLFVSTNDGQIHIIDDATGKEEWAFIPPEMLGRQYDLMQDADGKHTYGVDGSPTFSIVDHNGDGVLDPAASPADTAYMFIGMRRGGRKIFAFDLLANTSTQITSPTTALSPKLMWVIEGGKTTGFERLGYTFSSPQVRDIRIKCVGGACGADGDGDSQSKTVLIFGGGYDTDQDTGGFASGTSAVTNPYGDDKGSTDMGNGIYIADPTDGSLIWSAGSNEAGSTATLKLDEMIYSIPSDPAMVDTNGDGAVDRLYVGDMGGLVWRIDLSNQLDVDSNGATKGYVFADLVCLRNSSTNARDCTNTTKTTLQSWRKMFYSPDVAQLRDSIFSLVPDYDVVVVSTGNRADPVDKQTINATALPVVNTIVALRDFNIGTGPPGVAAIAIDQEDIKDLTDNQLQDDTDANYAQNKLELKASKGWVVIMKEATAITVAPLIAPATTKTVGEKGLAKPVIFDGFVYVTTYTPANNVTATVTCASTEGLGKIYALGIFDATAGIDLDGDGTADRFKNVGGGIPSELVTVIREGGVTGLVGTSGGAASPNIGKELPRGKTYWYEE